MAFIKAEKLKHRFVRRDENGEICGETMALAGVDLEVERGQFVVVAGRNGSGKSTFARHLNVLLFPSGGTLTVDGKDASAREQMWEIRKCAGMVFQNPDNQIVAGVVEEDVAFGPENLGIPGEMIEQRVTDSLKAVDMTAYRYHSPGHLSGGQKQRIAVAGVLAMQPDCIIMDESTAMLDPAGRREVLDAVCRLNREMGVTVIWITHYMEEAVGADRIFVMDGGRVVMQGTPRQVFSQTEALRGFGLDVPQITKLATRLKRAGMDLKDGILTRRELEKELAKRIQRQAGSRTCGKKERRAPEADPVHKKVRICMEQVGYTYAPGTPEAAEALKNLNLSLYEGEYVGIIGHTGSGKSTLIQLMNGLLRADTGRIWVDGEDISEKGFSMRELRSRVGLIFQYPEYQLFESSVEKDAAFGPRNQGLSQEEAMEKAREALRRVGLPQECWDRPPFELSGGQKRRAALAGVIAMEPEVLILDEPAAGLDPQGRHDLFELIGQLRRASGMTVVLVSHSMEDVADHVERVVVLEQGSVLLDGTPAQVFSRRRKLEEAGLSVPQVTALMCDLHREGYPVDRFVTTVDEAEREILKLC